MSLRKSMAFLFAAVAILTVFWSCGPQPLAGGTSETTNGFAAEVRSAAGAPVSHARVRLRPKEYLSDTGASVRYDGVSIVDTVTDSSGRFSVTGIDTGAYFIEIQDGRGEGALLKSRAVRDSVVDCGVAVVKPAGSIRGCITAKNPENDVAVYVRVYGMERMVRADLASGGFILPDMPLGNHEIYFIASSPSVGSKEISVSVASDSAVDVGKVSLFPFNGWAYSRVVGLNTAASGADIAGDVYAFPVLIRLNAGNFSFGRAQANGGDIRFAKSDSTPLPFEIERWDPVAGLAEVWVRVDTVRGNDGTQSIVMFWGNPGAAASSNSAAVFDTTAGFQGVWHLSEGGDAAAFDATANRYDGTASGMSGASSVSGAIGKARIFDGTSSYIAMPNTKNSKLNFPNDSYYTVNAWVLLDTFDNASHCIVAKGYEQYYLRSTYISKSIQSSSPLWEFVEFSETAKWQTCTSPAASRQWALLVGVRRGERQLLYCNGALVDSTVDVWYNTVSRNTANDLTIGRFAKPVTVPINEGYCFFKGSIDEVRICSAARSADWIRLCYMNQRSDDRLVIQGK